MAPNAYDNNENLSVELVRLKTLTMPYIVQVADNFKILLNNTV